MVEILFVTRCCELREVFLWWSIYLLPDAVSCERCSYGRAFICYQMLCVERGVPMVEPLFVTRCCELREVFLW